MSTILAFVAGVLGQAIALKLALAVLGQASTQNKFTTALGVIAMLNVATFAVGFIPIIGGFIAPLVWLLIIMAVYNTGFLKSIGVGLAWYVFQLALKWLLTLIGLQTAGVDFGLLPS